MTLIEKDLGKLSEHEEEVLRLLFGIGALAHSHDALGRRFGIGTRSVRQIERQALRHLRCAAVSEDSAEPRSLRATRRSAAAQV